MGILEIWVGVRGKSAGARIDELRANDLVGFQLGYFVHGEAQQIPEDVLVVLAQGATSATPARG